MTVGELPGYLKQHCPVILEQLRSGTYPPQAVKRVEIAKPDGGMRQLGIPTVLDRFIQQATENWSDVSIASCATRMIAISTWRANGRGSESCKA